MPEKSYIIANWKAIYPVLSAEIDQKELERYNEYLDERERNKWDTKAPQKICEELGLKTDPSFLQFGRYCLKLKEITSKEKVRKDEVEYLYNQISDIKGPLYGKDTSKYKKGKQEQSDFNFFIATLIEEEKWKLNKTFTKIKHNVFIDNINADEVFKHERPINVQKDAYRALDDRIETLNKRLEKLDDNMHINSSAFKAMKKTMKDINNYISGHGYVDSRTFGDKLAALHEAALNYVNAKGISNQSTQLGKDRMNFAMDVLRLTYANLDNYPTTKRYNAHVEKEIAEHAGLVPFEEDDFGSFK